MDAGLAEVPQFAKLVALMLHADAADGVLLLTAEAPERKRDRVLEVVGPTRIGAWLNNHSFNTVAGGFERLTSASTSPAALEAA